MKKKLLCLILIVSFAIPALTSCLITGNGELFLPEGTQIGDTTINVEGGPNYDIQINSSSDKNLLAASRALLSAVSVRCKFAVMVSRDILTFAKEYNDEKIISTELEIGEAISKHETTKDYDALATTLCQIAEKAVKANDISYAYDLVSRALQNMADDDCLMRHVSWPVVSNDNREGVFLNAVRYLYSGHVLDAQRLLEDFLIFNPEHFGAMYLLARAHEMQGDTEKLKDSLDDMAHLIKKALDNGMDSTAFRKFYYRRAILHSELCGTADGITLLKMLIKENPRYDKYQIAVRNIIRKYKKYLETEISESNTPERLPDRIGPAVLA